MRGDVPPAYLDVFADWLACQSPDVVHLHSLTRGVSIYHARCVKSIGAGLVHTIHVPGVTCARGTMMQWGKTPCDGLMQPQKCAACLLSARGFPQPLARFLAHTPDSASRMALASRVAAAHVLGYRAYIEQRTARALEYLNLADHIVVVCQWLYDVMRRNGVPDAKLSLCRHGLSDDVMRQSALARRERFVSPVLRVGYVGRFDPIKGVHVLVAAVKRLPASVPVQLKLHGRAQSDEECRYLDKLKSLAGGDSRIQFGGELTPENRVKALRELDLLAVPSVWFETGPFVVLEAFAAGLPVIGSRLGGVAELVRDGENGILVDAASINAWSATLENLSRSPVRVRELARKIPQVRRSQAVVEEMVRLYGRVIQPCGKVAKQAVPLHIMP